MDNLFSLGKGSAKFVFFNAMFLMPSDEKPAFANIFHKVYYKMIKIPYGPLGSIKNTIPQPAGFGLRPQPLGCGMVFLMPPSGPYGIIILLRWLIFDRHFGIVMRCYLCFFFREKNLGAHTVLAITTKSPDIKDLEIFVLVL